MMNEVWVAAQGFEDKFEVSTRGRVRSVGRWVDNWPMGRRFLHGKLLSANPCSQGGYVVVTTRAEGKKTNVLAHRLIAQAFIPNPMKLPCVNHKDGCKTNNRPHNLEWCTHQQNMAHAATNGWMKSVSGPGEQSPAHKITDQQVYEIKKRLLMGESCREIAASYPVGESAIREIKMGRSWAHIEIEGLRHTV